MTARVVRGALGLLALGLLSGCEPGERVPPRDPKTPRCPPPPEPAYQAAVVGTIGKLHLVESRYPISRLGDVLAAFKPDLLLVGVRVEPFREGHLEDASFEMTYVTALAKQHRIDVEPIDWFRDQDLGAAEAPAEPWDEAGIAKREAALLGEPRLFTFEVANGQELAQKVLLATDAEARHRAGNPLLTRRHAWMQHLAASAVERRARPKKVLAYVDALLHGLGYAMKEPVALVTKAKEEMISAIPGDVLDDWKGQLARARANAESAKTPPEKAFWTDRARSLGVVVDKHGQCCVGQSSVDAEK
jgi:hypothetical protein